MEHIKKSIRDTEKKCECGGSVVETFSKKYGKSNGVVGPGYHRPSWVSSDGFGCNKCGRQYGEPVFTTTKATAQIEFELTLSKGILTKKISIEDLPTETNFVQGKKVSFVVGNNEKLEGHELVPKEMKAKKLPTELKGLTIGTELFIAPSDSRDHRNLFSTIQLSNKKGSKTFRIKHSCIS